MSNPASFATAATTEGNNTFAGDQTVTGALAVTATPVAGLVIYNTTTNKLNLRVAAGWEVITSA